VILLGTEEIYENIDWAEFWLRKYKEGCVETQKFRRTCTKY